VDHFAQRDDVDVVELFKDGYFADGGGGDALLLGLQPDFLEGENLACLFVCMAMGLPWAL